MSKTFVAYPAWIMPQEAIEAASQNIPFNPAGPDFEIEVIGECHSCDHKGVWPCDLETDENSNFLCASCAQAIEESAS